MLNAMRIMPTITNDLLSQGNDMQGNLLVLISFWNYVHEENIED